MLNIFFDLCSMGGRQVLEVPPANIGGSPFCIAICLRGMDIQKVNNIAIVYLRKKMRFRSHNNEYWCTFSMMVSVLNNFSCFLAKTEFCFKLCVISCCIV